MSKEKEIKKIKRLSKYAKNPEFARFEDEGEKNEHLENIASGLKPVSRVTSFIEHFLDEVKPKKGEDYLTDEELDGIKKSATPIYKKDYLTDEELKKIKEEITPIFGKHYFNEPKDVIEELKKLTGNDRLDISNLRNGEHLARLIGKQKANDGDQRWHGGAPTLIAGANITLTPNGGKLTIASTGGGGIGLPLVFTGSVNGSNQTFTTTGTVTFVVSDGLWFQANDNNSVAQWRQSGNTVTLVIPPPNNAIWGF